MSRVRWMAVTTALGVSAAGVLTVATTPTVHAQAETAAAPTTAVQIARDHSVTMPQQLRPGVHRFVVRSARRAAFQLVMPDRGYTKAEAARDVNSGLGDQETDVAALRRFERNVTLLGGVTSTARRAGVLWARLRPGTYWAVDTNVTPARTRHLLTVRVTGAKVSGALPGGAVIRAVNAVDWAARPKVINRSGRMVFRNDSTDNHFIAMAKLKAGKTMKDFRQWLNAIQQGTDTPPPVREDITLDTGVLSPGKQMTMNYSMPRGNYVMICWWPDADMGGMPHAFMGMYRGIRLR